MCIESIVFAMEQKTTIGIKETSTVVILENKLFKRTRPFLREGNFSERLAAARPTITAIKINCSMSDFWKGVMILLGTMPTMVSLIEIFTVWVTIKSINLATFLGFMPDFSPLVTLIGSIVSEVIGLAAYYVKSTKENTIGGIVYESAAAAHFQENDGSVG